MTNPIPIGYKHSPLGPVPNERSIGLWKDIFGYIPSYSFSRKDLVEEPNSNTPIHYIHYGDIHAKFSKTILNLYDSSATIPYLDNNLVHGNDFSLLNEGDIVMADASEDYEGIGSLIEIHGVENKKVIAGLHTIALRDKLGKTLTGYRGYIFMHPSVKKELKRIATGISVLGISKSNLSKVKLALPPLPEQKAIASILSSCDETISQTQQFIDKLESRHKALCQQLLTGKKRVEGFNDNWKEEKIGKYITYTPRAVEKPSTNYLALGVRSHAKGMFQKPETNQNENAMDILYEVKKDDLVMSITFAREHAVAIARDIDDGGLVSHRFPTYTFKEGLSTPRFFKFFIKQPRFKYELGAISPGGAGRNRVLSKKDFLKLHIIVPKFDEQIAIAEILESSESEVKKAKRKLNQLKQLKKGLMQQLLTGKTRVPQSYLTE